jgi:hypothetical protein
MRQYCWRAALLTTAAIGGLGAAASARAEDPSFEIYGYAQADYVQDFKRVDPAWDDTLRPSRIPTVDGQFGSNGQSIISARQSRFGLKASHDVGGKPMTVKFEFDLFGTGDHEGQTTPRLQHFYGTWGPILAGQTDTVFMDGDTFPNTVDYWGPSGMVYVRNPQVRLTFKSGSHEFAVAIEKPNNDIDPGAIRVIDPALASSIRGDEKAPDFTAHWRYDGGWGHVQIAGLLRSVGFETIGTVDHKPNGTKLGWGINAASNIKVGKQDVLHLSAVYGEGIASYMNDGGMDLGPKAQRTLTPTQPIAGVPPTITGLSPDVVPLLGLMIYYDHFWSDKWSTSLGWSQTKVDNLNFQTHDTFRSGQYASINLLYKPDKRFLMGTELLWGERQDKDGAAGSDMRLQFSFKYSFTSKDILH